MAVERRTVRYGLDPSQLCDLYLPSPSDQVGPLPVVVVVHGGYWRASYGRELGTPLAEDLAAHGVAAWNIEYRRLGSGAGGGGGWPTTLLDVAAAIDALASEQLRLEAGSSRLDLSNVGVVGHSAGGQLAMWIAARTTLPRDAPGCVAAGDNPAVVVRGVVSQAGVLDLVRGYDTNLSNGAVCELLGGSPHEVPARYRAASPCELVPAGVAATLVHGLDDDVVPIEQSNRYAAAASAAGVDVDLIRLPGVNHFALIDPRSAAWALCRQAVLGYVGVPAD